MATESGRTGQQDIPQKPQTQRETSSGRTGGRGQTVREVMTPNPQTISPNETLQRAAQLMVDHDCGALPVVDGNNIVGIITDRDIVVRVIAKGRNPAEAKVTDAMTKGAQSVRETDSLDRVMQIMSSSQVRRVPVVNDQNKVVGIIAQADLATEARDEKKVESTVEAISEKSGNQGGSRR